MCHSGYCPDQRIKFSKLLESPYFLNKLQIFSNDTLSSIGTVSIQQTIKKINKDVARNLESFKTNPLI